MAFDNSLTTCLHPLGSVKVVGCVHCYNRCLLPPLHMVIVWLMLVVQYKVSKHISHQHTLQHNLLKTPVLVDVTFMKIQNTNTQITPAYCEAKLNPRLMFCPWSLSNLCQLFLILMDIEMLF